MGFEDLKVWQQAHQLTVEVYKLARQFPADERFRYTNQILNIRGESYRLREKKRAGLFGRAKTPPPRAQEET